MQIKLDVFPKLYSSIMYSVIICHIWLRSTIISTRPKCTNHCKNSHDIIQKSNCVCNLNFELVTKSNSCVQKIDCHIVMPFLSVLN